MKRKVSDLTFNDYCEMVRTWLSIAVDPQTETTPSVPTASASEVAVPLTAVNTGLVIIVWGTSKVG